MWLTFPRLVGALSPILILSGCGFGAATAGNQNVLASPALKHSKAASTYDAIRQMRPEMLRSRGSGSLMLFAPRQPAVAIDNVIVGGPEALRAIPVSEVDRIEYVNSWKAAKQYGLKLRDGLVLVTRRTGSDPALSLNKTRASH
jgi:hypothetical protein